METIEAHPNPLPSSPAGEGIGGEPAQPIATLPAPVLPSPVLEEIRRGQHAMQETADAREARTAKEAKIRREQEAFRRLLPGLLRTHCGQFVAIHDEQVVGAGPDQVEVADRAYERFGYIPLLVTLVTERPRVVRIPSPRLAGPGDRA